MSGSAITRREALRGLSWIAVAVASGQAFSGCSKGESGSLALQGLAGLLAHGETAAAVGAVFLAAHPEEADLDKLVKRLGLSANSLPAPGSPELEAAAKAIHVRHINDFREGRLVEIEGWNLSITELRLAAITHLARRK